MTDALPSGLTPPDATPDTPENVSMDASASASPSGNKRRRRPRRNALPAPAGASSTAPARKIHPLLEQLAALHPQLFGARFLPLKRGIFEDLLARHGELLPRDELKLALGQHARSTRYLDCIASGLPRHDLDGQPVEPMAPEHRHHAILEVFRRRQNQGTGEAPQFRRAVDPRERARTRLVALIESCGLSQAEYQERMRTGDEVSAALLAEAFAEIGQQAAKNEALLRAFEASHKSEAEFAEMYGMSPETVQNTLARARLARQVETPATAIE